MSFEFATKGHWKPEASGRRHAITLAKLDQLSACATLGGYELACGILLIEGGSRQKLAVKAVEGRVGFGVYYTFAYRPASIRESLLEPGSTHACLLLAVLPDL